MITLFLSLSVPENILKVKDKMDDILVFYDNGLINDVQNAFKEVIEQNKKIEIPLPLGRNQLFDLPYSFAHHPVHLDRMPVYKNSKAFVVCPPPKNQILFTIGMDCEWNNRTSGSGMGINPPDNKDTDEWVSDNYSKLQLPTSDSALHNRNHIWLKMHGSYKLNKKTHTITGVRPTSLTCELIWRRSDSTPSGWQCWKSNHFTQHITDFPIYL